jgi:sulfur-oxidizing protein SoxZ
MADPPRARTLIHLPAAPPRGQPFEVRATIAHPMETGLRSDGFGNVVPRSVITRFECRIDGRLAFQAEMHPAIAANPYFSFWLRADAPATLSFEWTGENAFAHRETRRIEPA